jgi:hypothetical protein
VMNSGDGLYGGMFVCGMYSAAFFERDVRRIVIAGLECIPKKSGYGQVIDDVLKSYFKNRSGDWRVTWQAIEEKYDRDDPCPGGALQPFNIDARLNGAYIAIGLLYGNGDFAKTLEITTRCGQDSDCNPSSAAGVLGVILGYSGIPDVYKSSIPKIATQKFEYTEYSFNDIVRSTVERAKKVVQAAGGTIGETLISVPYQRAKPAKMEQWDMGVPERVVPAADPSWVWSGAWADQPGNADAARFQGKSAVGVGAETVLAFTGSAVLLIGPHRQDGGRADVYLDGKKVGEIESYIVERTTDDGLWHTYGLPNQAHTLRIVPRDDADPRSTGKKTTILAAVTFRPKK